MLDNPGTEARRFIPFPSASAWSAAAEPRRVRCTILDSIGRDVSKPLAAILGAAAGLKSHDRSDDALNDGFIETIQNEAARLERFVSILLDMAKLESGSVEPRISTFALKDIVGKAVKDAASAMRQRRVEVSLPADLPSLRVDPAILRRVLLILIDNAARLSPPGSTIGVHAGRDRTAVRVQILDEGEGIPPAELAGVFDQFHLPCGDEQTRWGSGMQLAVCRGYIEAMGATISGSNRTDRSGAVFTITFPVSA